MSLEDIESTIRKVKMCMYPDTGLICLENTYHGRVISLDYCKKVKELG